jgi:SAM-dependent methyltransferase
MGPANGLVNPSSYRRWRESLLGSITERLEMETVFELAGPLLRRKVLDAGCGDGTYIIEASKREADVVGVDASVDMLEAARERAKRCNVHADVRLADVRALPFADGVFDVVVAVTVLCFQSEPGEAIREFARVLAPGGRIVIGELGRWSTWALVRRLRGLLGDVAWRKARFQSAQGLSRLIENEGLSVERMRGCVYYPPLGMAARLLFPLDRQLGKIIRAGAAFIVTAASRPLENRKE